MAKKGGVTVRKNFKFLVFYKIFFGLLGFSAIVTEIAVIIERGVFNAANFFSFFTIQTNILVVVALILSALYVAAGKTDRRLDIFRAAVTVYILVVGIGFAVLLSGLQNVALTAVPWDNSVLHYIIPFAVLLDYLIDRPRSTITFRYGLLWIIYPVAYVVYSLVRGNVTGWYPYPFLNPNVAGFAAVGVTVAGLVILGIVLIAVITAISQRRT